MYKRYWYILLTYILMQFSGYLFGFRLLITLGYDKQQAITLWLFISFLAALIITILLLMPEIKNRGLDHERISRASAIKWSILGVFYALGAQYVAAIIETYVLGIEIKSENTEMIVQLAKMSPLVIIATSVIGPILEEIIFRKIIFGTLHKRFNFIVAALISSLIFATVHMDFEHIIRYFAMGYIFAYLYVKTKRIIVPIIAHVAMNSFVMIVRVIFSDYFDEMQKTYEKMQSFIGGY